MSKLARHSSIQMTADVYLELGLDREEEGELVLPPLLSTTGTRGPAGGPAEMKG